MFTGGWLWMVRGLALFLPAAWELFFGATLILLFALLLNFGLRNRAAALRHRIWGLSAIGLLLLPLLCPLLPKLPLKLDIPIAGTHSLPAVFENSKEPVVLPPSRIDVEKDFPSLSTMTRTSHSIPLAPSMAASESMAIAADSGLQTSSSATAEQARMSSGGPSFWLKSCSVLMLLWLVGILWGLMATVCSLWVSRRLRRDAVPLADLSWQKLFEELRGQLDVRRTVSLGVGKRTIFPLCIGFWKPAILLPADCIEWTPEKRRAVLVHELSHVARNDVFWQIAAQLACILFWIHPLAWLAARRMRIERERACDDAVLLFGGQAAEYASILLDVAATICGRHAECGTAAVAMACQKPVEQRIRAILQPGLSRLPVGPRMAKALLIGTMTLVALTAALHPFAPQRQTQANDVVVKEKAADDTEKAKEIVKEVDKQLEATEKKREKEDDSPGNKNAKGFTTVRGKVVDEQGKPVEGVTISMSWAKPIGTVKSDSEGRFEVKNVLQQIIRFSRLIARTEDRSQQAFFPFRNDDIEARREAKAVRLVLKPARRISVQVVDAKGAAIADSIVGVKCNYDQIDGGRSDPFGKLLLQIPADATLQKLYAFKSGEGLDYLTFPPPDIVTTGDVPQPPDLSQTLILKLTGAKTVRIKLIDPEGNPIEGIPVSPWYFKKSESGNMDEVSISNSNDFTQKTDAAGIVEFDWIPTWQKQTLTFWPHDPLRTKWRINWEPEKDPADKTVKLQRLVPVRGEVHMADGSPAAGIEIWAHGLYIGAENEQLASSERGKLINDEEFLGAGETDDRGEFKILVAPDCKYAFVVKDDKWVAPVRANVLVRPDKPVEHVDFQLQLGTRVHGQLTWGPEKKPWADKSITLTPQYFDGHSTSFGKSRWNATDADGRYVFCVESGEYVLRTTDSIPEKTITVIDQKELEINFNAPRKDRGPITVHVADQSDPPKPLAMAKVHGQGIYNMPGGSLDGTTNILGWFHTERNLEKMVLYAFSNNKKLADCITISGEDGEDEDVTLSLKPVGSAKGQVIDQATGRPAANLNIQYEVHYYYENPQYKGTSSSYLAGSTKTDAEGRFVMNDLVPGQKYSLKVPLFDENTPTQQHRYDSLGEVQVESGEMRDLGIVKFRKDFNGGEMLDLIFAGPDNRLKELTADAKNRYQRVLIEFFNPTGESHQQLNEICKNHWASTFIPFYVICSPVDKGQLQRLKVKYAEKWGVEIFEEAWPLFCILDTDGKTLLLKSGREFVKDGKVDDAKIKTVFEKFALETPDAEKLLADAQAKAAKENKRIFLLMAEGVNQSPPSSRLSEVLDEHRQTLEQDYVFVTIDAKRWKNGEAVITRLRSNPDRSVPWVAILDPEAKVMATSDSPAGTIGCPSKPEEIDLFLKMLSVTATRLTEKEYSALRKSFEKIVKSQ